MNIKLLAQACEREGEREEKERAKGVGILAMDERVKCSIPVEIFPELKRQSQRKRKNASRDRGQILCFL